MWYFRCRNCVRTYFHSWVLHIVRNTRQLLANSCERRQVKRGTPRERERDVFGEYLFTQTPPPPPPPPCSTDSPCSSLSLPHFFFSFIASYYIWKRGIFGGIKRGIVLHLPRPGELGVVGGVVEVGREGGGSAQCILHERRGIELPHR